MTYSVTFRFSVPAKEINRVMKRFVDFYGPENNPLGEGDDRVERVKFDGPYLVGRRPIKTPVSLEAARGLLSQLESSSRDSFVESRNILDVPAELIGVGKPQGARFRPLSGFWSERFCDGVHEIRINYRKDSGVLSFELSTSSSGVNVPQKAKLDRISEKREKKFVASAHNFLSLMTRPLMDAGYKPTTEHIPFEHSRFIMTPNRQSGKIGGLIKPDQMKIRYVSTDEFMDAAYPKSGSRVMEKRKPFKEALIK